MDEEIRLLQESVFDSPEGQEILSLLQSVQTNDAHTASYSVCSDGCFSGYKAAAD
jgi:hypothetical protein